MGQSSSPVEETFDEEGCAQVVTGSDHRKRKVDLDAILVSQGNQEYHIPKFDVGGKENVPDAYGVDDDDALLDMVAAMPPLSQHEGQMADSLGDLDDIDALLDLEEGDVDVAGECCGDDEEMIMLAEDEYNAYEDLGKPVDVTVKESGDCLVIGDINGMKQHLKAPVQGAFESSSQPGGSTTQQDVPREENNCLRDIIRDRSTPLPQKDALNATEKYVTVTSMSGERVYAPIFTEDDNKGGHLTRALRRSKGCLLSTKIDDLLASVEKDHFERVLQETKVTKRKQKKDPVAKQETSQDHGVSGAQKSGLWVDKYAPKTFMELLSDDMTNKDVVKWLMEWNHCVFGKAKTDSSNVDPYGRPEQKIILLAGPPGLGKTTLAHVVARHCGYKAVEINASDERNGPALLSRVVNAMEMTSMIGENRPNCIIIDEIDGASAGGEGKSAITTLIKLAKAVPLSSKGREGKPDEDDVDGIVQATRKKKKADKPLTRPIICICNDLYAPVLRPLRDVAKVFVVKPPGAERLVERLQNICKREKLKAEKSTLRALVDKTECDIRSCLNTMQFIAKKKRHLRLSDIASVGTGQKDVTVGAFRLWKDLLHLKVRIIHLV